VNTKDAIERMDDAIDGQTVDQLLLRMLRRRPEWVSEAGVAHAEAMRRRVCVGCGKPLPVTMRSHAEYCSGACKVRSWRKQSHEHYIKGDW